MYYRRPLKGNNSRAHLRRLREGFYEKYIVGRGLDIGCRTHERSIHPSAELWDQAIGSGDATYLRGVGDNTYSYVLSSHILEHVEDREVALKNWIRVVKPGGYLIVCVPDRDLFEGKKKLPSVHNHDHKCFFKLNDADPPDTYSLSSLLACIESDGDVVYAKTCSDDWPGHENKKREHSRKIYPKGEFQIEAVIRKKK